MLMQITCTIGTFYHNWYIILLFHFSRIMARWGDKPLNYDGYQLVIERRDKAVLFPFWQAYLAIGILTLAIATRGNDRAAKNYRDQ